MQMPVLKQLSLRAVMALLAASVLPACVMARAEAPPIPDVEQDDASQPAEQVYSTRKDDPPGEELENPDARIARVSFTQGGVYLVSGGETVQASATLNRPIVPGDDLSTMGDGKAEVDLGAVAVRLGGNSAVRFIALDERALHLRVSSGIANVRVRELGENDSIEVETPQAVMSILRPGNYRLEVNAAGGSTVVKVSSGALEARGGAGQSLVVRNQQTATLTGTSQLAFSTGTLGAPDSFDEWTLERDQRMDRARTAEASKYVPSDVVGYEDLDNYGSWRNDPDYGYVWAPTTVIAGWTPYRYGRYSYISGWGWTWIDDAPWGFAPFHYGSWVTIGGRWNWVPGPRHGGHYAGRPGYWNRPGTWNRPGNWNRPGQPRHDWHVPKPPRDSTVRNTPPLGVDSPRNGYRYLKPEQPGATPSQPQTGSSFQNGDRRMQIPRYERPGNTFPRNGSTFQRNDGQRTEGGQRESYRGVGGRYAVPVAPPPRAERRPEMRSSPPPQQQQPQQQQSSPQQGANRGQGGRFDRSNRGGGSTRER